MNLMNFFRADPATALRKPREHEAASITDALLHMPAPLLATISRDDLRTMVVDAIAEGGGIVIIGMAQADLEISGDRFAAHCLLRLSTSKARIDMRVSGSIDDLGRVVPEEAVLDSMRLPIAA